MQKIKTLYNQPIILSEDKTPPTTLRVLVPLVNEMVGGVPGAGHKGVTYVLYDVLPEELKQRIVTAIQAITAGM